MGIERATDEIHLGETVFFKLLAQNECVPEFLVWREVGFQMGQVPFRYFCLVAISLHV